VVLRIVVELAEVHHLGGAGAVRDLARRCVQVGLGTEDERGAGVPGGHKGSG
jgi:hypothetical protein